MSKLCLLLISLALLFSTTRYALAGAALEQRVKAAEQQRQLYQQAIAQQQQAAYTQAQQQMLQQRQAAINQAQQQAVSQAQQIYAQKMAAQSQAAVQQAYAIKQQQTYAVQQQQALMQEVAIRQAQSAQQQIIQQSLQQQQMMNQMGNNVLSSLIVEPPVADVVDMQRIWDELEYSSEVWPLIIDNQPKEITISRYIDMYKEQGVIIRKPAYHYVGIIDSMAGQNSNLLKNPFSDILKIAAIVEYDFDNGQDKDLLARKVLGKDYAKNKERLGL